MRPSVGSSGWRQHHSLCLCCNPVPAEQQSKSSPEQLQHSVIGETQNLGRGPARPRTRHAWLCAWLTWELASRDAWWPWPLLNASCSWDTLAFCGLWKCFQYIILIFHRLKYGAAQSSPTQLQFWPLVQQAIKTKLKKEGGWIYHTALFLRSLAFRNKLIASIWQWAKHHLLYCLKALRRIWIHLKVY